MTFATMGRIKVLRLILIFFKRGHLQILFLKISVYNFLLNFCLCVDDCRITVNAKMQCRKHDNKPKLANYTVIPIMAVT